MTTEHDARTRAVVAWLREDAHENAERVLLAALNDVDTTQQRRSLGPAWRIADMNGSAKILVAVAAVIAVALAGIALLPRVTGPGGGPPAVTPAPTTTPSVELTQPAARLPNSGPIDAGTYMLGATPMEITVPAGWEAATAGFDVRKHPGQPNEVSLTSSNEIRVFPDACATDEQPPLTGPTADDLLAALRAQRNSDVSEPVEITIDEHAGVRVEIIVPENLDLADCTDGMVRIWEETTGYTTLTESETASMSIVQTDLGRIVFGTAHGPEATDEDLAELDAIIGSMAIND